MTTPDIESIRERLEYLRGEIRAERISMSELADLQDLAEHIDPFDNELLEWAGVPEAEAMERQRLITERLTTVNGLGALLHVACVTAWGDIVDHEDEWGALMAATIVVENYLTEQGILPGTVNPVDVAICALELTPAELQSFDRWCPGHGDEEDCEVDPMDPCRACRFAGAQQDQSL